MGKAKAKQEAYDRGWQHALQCKGKDPFHGSDHERVGYDHGYAAGRKALDQIVRCAVEQLEAKYHLARKADAVADNDASIPDPLLTDLPDAEPQRLWGLPIRIVDDELTRQYGWYIVSHPAYEPPRGPGGRGEGLTGEPHA